MAALCLIAIYCFQTPFPAIVLSGGIIGFLGGLLWKSKFNSGSKECSGSTLSVIGDEEEPPPHTKPNLARAFRVSVVWLTLWLTPTLIVGAVHGWESTLFKEGLFFSKAAVVTFGGAYAVLPYVAPQVLFHLAWLKPGQMMDGL